MKTTKCVECKKDFLVIKQNTKRLCKRCYSKIKQSEYRKNNPEKSRESSLKYYYKNREKRIEYAVKYDKQRRLTDPVYKFKCDIRRTIRDCFRYTIHSKTSRTEDILGCSFNELRQYIKKKFKNGMSFKNRGLWHIDHIVPLSTAKNKQDIIRLNHYTNLQPLWASENLKKK